MHRPRDVELLGHLVRVRVRARARARARDRVSLTLTLALTLALAWRSHFCSPQQMNWLGLG